MKKKQKPVYFETAKYWREVAAKSCILHLAEAVKYLPINKKNDWQDRILAIMKEIGKENGLE